MIRKAHTMDVLALAELLPKYQPETDNHQNFPVDIEHSMNRVIAAIADPDSCVLVAVRGTEIIGFLYAVVSTFFWSTTPVAIDQLLYIDPKHRGGSHGVSLIRRYEEWCRGKGVAEARLSISSGITGDRTRKLYLALGYEPLGYVYRKELNSGKRTVTTEAATASTETR